MTYQRPCHFRAGESGFHPTHDVWAHLYERLCWQYGPSRALEKVRGRDMESRLDELAWRTLGEPK